jgi:hypothetical protein
LHGRYTGSIPVASTKIILEMLPYIDFQTSLLIEGRGTKMEKNSVRARLANTNVDTGSWGDLGIDQNRSVSDSTSAGNNSIDTGTIHIPSTTFVGTKTTTTNIKVDTVPSEMDMLKLKLAYAEKEIELIKLQIEYAKLMETIKNIPVYPVYPTWPMWPGYDPLNPYKITCDGGSASTFSIVPAGPVPTGDGFK